MVAHASPALKGDNMALFEPAVTITLANEGSALVDDPNDAGGLSRYGISQRSYPAVNIRELTEEQAKLLYKKDFWKYDDVIDQPLANKIFDASVNMGNRAILILQGLVFQALKPDAVWGPETLDCVNRADAGTLLAQYRSALAQHYRNIVANNPEDEKFLEGWLRRAES
jgi:type VI secretion system secreted protein VgrG